MTLGNKIKQLRQDREMTQKDLAEKIGVEVTYLSKIENNRLPPYLSEEKLKKIVSVLGLNNKEEDDLFGLAKKIPSSIKEMVEKPSVQKFLRTIPDNWSDNQIENYIKKGFKNNKK